MSNIQQNFNAGQTQGQTQEKAGQWTQSAKEGTANATQSAQQELGVGSDQSSSFIQETGSQMKNMAQGTIDGVKNALGMGDKH